MTLVESLPTTGWNGRDLTPVMASVGLEVRRILGETWEDENSDPVAVPVEDGGIVRVPVFFKKLDSVSNSAGQSIQYTVTATCQNTPGFETAPRVLTVSGVSVRDTVVLSGTHGMSTAPAAVVEYARAYGSILSDRMNRMGIKSKSMGNVNVSYADPTGYTPEQEALQVTGSAVLAYRLRPMVPSFVCSETGWWGL